MPTTRQEGGHDSSEHRVQSDSALEPITKTVAGMSAVYQSLSPVFGINPRTESIDERHRHAARMILLHAGVWLPTEVYERWPVLFPWMRRDNSKVHLGHKGEADPNSGHEIQDNGPIGTLKRNLPVQWAGLAPVFHAKPIASGTHEWMQSHCWDGMTTLPLTNSFVPNLMWLPHGLGRLTDDPGSLFDQESRRIAWSLYRHIAVPDPLKVIVDGIWAHLPQPHGELLTPDELSLVNFFGVDEKFHHARKRDYADHWEAARRAEAREPLEGLKLRKKYRETLPLVSPDALASLASCLEPFARAAESISIPAQTTTTGKPKKPVGATSSVPKTYRLSAPSGVTVHNKRSSVALATITALIGAGVAPSALHQKLPARYLTSVRGNLAGAELEEALLNAQAKGVPERWFMKFPIFSPGITSVVSSNAWFEKDEQRLIDLCGLSKGLVTLEILPEGES